MYHKHSVSQSGENAMIGVKRGFGVLLAAMTLGALGSFPAFAQNAERREEPIRVQVTLNLFFAGPTGESEEAVKLRDRVRRSIYEMAAGECTLIEQVLAKTCRLESINLGLNRQASAQFEGYMATGNFVMRVTLK
jgi:hypothetical protein